MATIVNDAHRFVFVHIPKCAGMSISVQMREKGLDWDTRFVGKPLFDHPQHGKMMLAHLPLEVLADLFPEVLEKYRTYVSYAVIREPGARFASAVAQHLREFRDTDLYDLREPELAQVLDDIMGQMVRTPVWFPVDYVHFSRQVDYIDLGAERVVNEIYTTATLDQFFARFAERTGVALDAEDTRNATVAYRSPQLKRVMHSGGSVLRRLIPSGIYWALRDRARSLATVSTKQKSFEAFGSDTVQDFLREFYALDYALWEQQTAISATGR